MVVISGKSCKRGDRKVGFPCKNNRECFSSNVGWVSTKLKCVVRETLYSRLIPQTYFGSSLLSLFSGGREATTGNTSAVASVYFTATRQTLPCFANFSLPLSCLRTCCCCCCLILVSLFLFLFINLFVFRLAVNFIQFISINLKHRH